MLALSTRDLAFVRGLILSAYDRARFTDRRRMGTERSSRPVAVITGAGSPDGIGFACARRLAEDHAVVIASTTERIHDRAEQLWAVNARALSASSAT